MEVTMENTIEPHEELQELLNDSEPENLNDEKPVSAPEKEDETTGEKVEAGKVDDVQPEPEAEKEVPPTYQKTDNDARFNAMLAKNQDEVAKRQALEQKLEAVNAKFDAMSKPDNVDFDEDPQGFVTQMHEGLDSKIQQHQVATDQNNAQGKLAMSEMIVRSNVGDEKYTAATKAFAEAAQQNPSLVTAMHDAAVPAKFAYDQGNAILFQKDVGSDPQAYKERVRKEIIAEMATDNKAAEKQATIDALPTTIAGQGTSAPKAGDLPDDDLATLLGE